MILSLYESSLINVQMTPSGNKHKLDVRDFIDLRHCQGLLVKTSAIFFLELIYDRSYNWNQYITHL